MHTQHAQEVYELHLEPLEGFEAPSRSIWASRGPSFRGASCSEIEEKMDKEETTAAENLEETIGLQEIHRQHGA